MNFQPLSKEDKLALINNNTKIRKRPNLFRELIKNKAFLFSIITIIILIIISTLAFLSPYKQDAINLGDAFLGMSPKHFFGTDDFGRDYFTRCLYGTRISLLVGISSMLLSILLGTVIGAGAGYFGGIFDSISMRIIDMLLSIPSFFIILTISMILKPGIPTIIIIISIFSWMSVARIIRSETLTLREREYVLCARMLGLSELKIIRKHIIPNLLPIIITSASIVIAESILLESSISFLGFGVRPPNASLGSMLQDARTYATTNPLLAIFPGIIIFLIVLSFNLIGDIIRRKLDRT